ncbi:RNase P and RNase MRP subunit [Podospora pseudopauciseta]|uniref:RNase P and RNase MRP subunit n=2 Tax=Podospora TaxID=5144 RepID=A0ABR0H0C4_9PEZI|nr:RNase P and RNase MRP subunit [Podospora pseudopauciseta]KAK4668104.1 RNase P and RNase MRP subunit [Podospora pseudoanserina]
MERKRIVHTLDTPFSVVEWPQISQEDQDVILELLCHLLSPLGTHRRLFVTPSKGMRDRKRKRAQDEDPVPPTPELAGYVDVGLSHISRTLQTMSGKDAKPYSVVFVARSGQSSAFHCHFPQMVALASRSQPPEKAVRLVGISKACEDKLSAALGIPRVSSIALREDAPQAKGLVDFVREHVKPVEVAWLKEARAGQYLDTKIDAVPTKIGVKKKA